MSYFVISCSESGVSVEQLDKKTLLERIQPPQGEEKGDYYGDVGFLDSIEKENSVYWRNNILIIKGEIVVPAPKDIVKTFDID